MRSIRWWLGAALFSPCIALAQEPLEDLSLEELLSLDLQVTSASKQAEELSKTSAAIYAVTGDEIRRIGATNLAESLRIVPGMHVARADSKSWAISARGFNWRFNPRMLVLLDGRSVYTPLFGGVFWEEQDVFLEDVEQVEVIRGPGGALWGANAINGVINVRTKPASRTLGLFAEAGGGNEETGFGNARFGAKLGERGAYRVSVRYADRDGGADPLGAEAFDGWRAMRGAFRLDLGSVTVQADAFGLRNEYLFLQDTTTPPYLEEHPQVGRTNGQSLTARWGSDVRRVQVYWDRVEHFNRAAHDVQNTADLDAQQTLPLGSWSTLTFGGGARFIRNEWRNGPILSMTPANRDFLLVNAYVQDQARLFGDRLSLIAGAKLEHNDITGFQVLPSMRAAFVPTDRQTLWIAASRAVRTPSRVERDGESPVGVFPPDLRILIQGNPDLSPEVLVALEGGYRVQVAKAFSLDVAGFHNDYNDVINADRDSPSAPFERDGEFYVAVPFRNLDDGVIYGGEAALKWNVNARFAIAGSWSHLYADLPNELDRTSTPSDFWNLRLYMNLTDSAEWNIAYYSYEPSGYYDEQRLRGNDLRIPAYSRLDMGFTVRFAKRFEAALWGQNLTNDRHVEVKEGFITPTTEVQRSFYGKLTTRF